MKAVFRQHFALTTQPQQACLGMCLNEISEGHCIRASMWRGPHQ